MPYADAEVRKQKGREYKLRPEVKERNNELYRIRYAENQNGLADKVKGTHYKRWQNPEYREKKAKRNLERWEENWSRQAICQIRARARKQNIEFNIDEHDIPLPEKCPIFGLVLVKGIGRQSNNSPSVDRIDPKKGYIKGNVVVVSNLANSMKREATIEDMKKLLAFYEPLIRKNNG
jgi:hypothetical protein